MAVDPYNADRYLWTTNPPSHATTITIGQFPPWGIPGLDGTRIQNRFKATADRFIAAYRGKYPSASMVPYSNNLEKSEDGKYVHWWQALNKQTGAYDQVLVQDVLFKNAGLIRQECLLIYNSETDMVYLVKEGFWGLYMERNGVVTLNVPITDEVVVSTGAVEQHFKRGYLLFDRKTPKNPSDNVLEAYDRNNNIIPEPTVKFTLASFKDITTVVTSNDELVVIASVGGSTTPTGPTGGAGNPEPLPPEIKVDITSLNFEEVEVGERTTLSFRVKNTGKGLGIIGGMFPFAPYLSQFWTSPSPEQSFSVAPNDSQRVEVFFTPTSTLPIVGALILRVDIPDKPNIIVSLFGRGKRTGPRQIITITDTLTTGMTVGPFIVVKAGQVLMGSSPDDPYGKSNERPRPLGIVSRDFGLMMHENGRGLWQAIAGNIPMTPRNLVDVFLPRINALAVGKAYYRLPSEVEWELAAGDGSHYRWFNGPRPDGLGEVAWYVGNTNHLETSLKNPAPNGFYHMYGNYGEICVSIGPYDSRRYVDPGGVASFMVRGGTWQDEPGDVSSASRKPIDPDFSDSNVSFRLLREITVAPVVSNPPTDGNPSSETDNTGNAGTTTGGTTAGTDTTSTGGTSTSGAVDNQNSGSSTTVDNSGTGSTGQNIGNTGSITENQPVGGNTSAPAPIVSVYASGFGEGSTGSISIPYNTPATIQWHAENVSDCLVSPGGWTGVNGEQTTGNLTASTVYTVSCNGPGGTAVAIVAVNIRLAAPKPYHPSNGLSNVPIRPDLLWKTSVGATAYELQISTSPSFSPLIVPPSGSGGFDQYGLGSRSFLWSDRQYSHVPSLAEGTLYYWRVRAQGSNWSEVFRFTTVSLAPAPAPPRLAWPSDKSRNISAEPTLYWHRSKGATAYQAQVADDSLFTKPVVNKVVAGQSCPVSGLIPAATYYWRVMGRSGNGTSAWSTVRRFTVAVPKPVNRPPRFPTTGFVSAAIIRVGTVWEHTVAAIDPDGDRVVYGLTTAHKFLRIDSTKGRTFGTPGASDVGKHPVVIKAYDPKGKVDSTSYMLEVVVALFIQGGNRAGKPAALGESAAFLHQNFPNPFNAETAISYFLPKAEIVRLAIHNLLGQEVAVLVFGAQEAGEHSVRFKGENLPSGVYFVRLTAGTEAVIRRMLLLK